MKGFAGPIPRRGVAPVQTPEDLPQAPIGTPSSPLSDTTIPCR
jgi:hypothetical protein